MPRVRLHLTTARGGWTKVPNHLLDSLIPTLSDTELRVLLSAIRRTTGWGREGRPTILRYRDLRVITGRHSEAVSKAFRGLEEKGLMTRVAGMRRYPRSPEAPRFGQRSATVKERGG